MAAGNSPELRESHVGLQDRIHPCRKEGRMLDSTEEQEDEAGQDVTCTYVLVPREKDGLVHLVSPLLK